MCDHFLFYFIQCFSLFFIFFIIIVYQRCPKSPVEHLKPIRKVLAFSDRCPMGARAHAGSTRQREVKWGKGFLVIVARCAFSFEPTSIFKRFHGTKYATFCNLKNIIVIAKTLAFFQYRFPTLKRSRKGGKDHV